MQAIGSSTTASYGQRSEGSTGLQAQLSRLEKELSACVNCTTAKTTEGKAKIEEVSTRISRVKERIVESSETAPNKAKDTSLSFTRIDTLDDPANNPPNDPVSNPNNNPATFSGDAQSRLGARIDTRA